MADEEALIIEQQLVELGCDRGVDAEPSATRAKIISSVWAQCRPRMRT